MTIHEEWRTIPGHTGYEVSSHGRVRSYRTTIKGWDGPTEPAMLSLRTDPAGYVRVALRADGEQKNRNKYVHRLVALAWHGEPGDREVHHINHIRDDNRPENLSYTTVYENRQKRRPRQKLRCPHCQGELW